MTDQEEIKKTQKCKNRVQIAGSVDITWPDGGPQQVHFALRHVQLFPIIMPDNPKEHNDNHTSESSKMSQDRRGDESNPFVALRRFADEQVSSMLQSIIGLPSSVSTPQNDRWAIAAHDDGHKEMNSSQPCGTENGTEQSHADGGATKKSGAEEKPR